MRSEKGYKLVKKRDYSQHTNIVDLPAKCKTAAELNALKGWFDSPQNRMSSKTTRLFVANFNKRAEELDQEIARAQAAASISNQT